MTMPPPAGNSLMIVDKIPVAWLVQIRDAGHGLMNQYPDQFNKIVSTFLEILIAYVWILQARFDSSLMQKITINSVLLPQDTTQ